MQEKHGKAFSSCSVQTSTYVFNESCISQTVLAISTSTVEDTEMPSVCSFTLQIYYSKARGPQLNYKGRNTRGQEEAGGGGSVGCGG